MAASCEGGNLFSDFIKWEIPQLAVATISFSESVFPSAAGELPSTYRITVFNIRFDSDNQRTTVAATVGRSINVSTNYI